MNKIQTVRRYLEEIGVDSTVLNEEFKDIEKVLFLNLPAVCILQENRPYSSSNQTHIHITGQGMKFFYDENILNLNPTILSNDTRENVILFKKNLIHLEEMAKDIHGTERKMDLSNEAEILDSYTVKKVGRIGSPSIQVQISKKRLDDEKFMHLRSCLFEGDVLVFIKTAKRNSIIVIGIPRSYVETNPLYNEVILDKRNIECNAGNENLKKDEKEYNRILRSVDEESIANFTNNDESGDTLSNISDLTEAIATRKRRTERHQHIVKIIALDLVRQGYSLYENPIDCLAVKDNHVSLLFEIKTLDGSISDERKQVQKAFSQLFYYEEFNTKEYAVNGVKKIAVFESKINDEHITFFETKGIEVFWLNDNKHLVDKDGIVKDFN